MRKLIVVMLLAVGLAALTSAGAAAKPRGTNGKIVTNADTIGGRQVYTVDPDGTDEQLIADNAEVGQWSPDGTRLTLFTQSDNAERIFNVDTGLSSDLGLPSDLYPDFALYCGVWSPDGARLACDGFGLSDSTVDGVYTLRSEDGGDLRQVTMNPGAVDCPSDYSPDGKRIVFTRADEFTYALFTVKVDGSGLRQVTPNGMQFDFCKGSWSPQRNEIVFSAHVPDLDYRTTIWVVHSDGSGLRQIRVLGCGGPVSDPNTVSCFNPVWSPDGQKIAFARNRGDQQRDIYTVNGDGTGLFQVTHTPDINELGGDWGTHPLTP